jgi:hypothetical protein
MHNGRGGTHEAVTAAFSTQFRRLHLQALVITGCPHLACECVLEAFDAVNDSYLASPEFAYEASKLATIKSGLRKVTSEIKQHAPGESGRGDKRANDISTSSVTSGAAVVTRDNFVAALLQLNVFHRALLLLRLLEGYRAHEVALLLRLPSNTIQKGLVEALLSLVITFNRTPAADNGQGGPSSPQGQGES